ncbi:c-type cytochrome [Shewanella fodinae]|uniref:c-type cytochrome n=1 Tax=Shewanella fodinae TaxID=552357 RepID=UPI00167AD1EB|nr:cytochrome c [Shewanella fodinae]MCL2906594.1 cytochrome c [Shewanella fodinae]GGZ01815.1 cytochrome c [Shewanella fodinae]
MRFKMLVLATIASSVLATAQAGEFKKPEDAIHYRQAVFEVLGHNFADIGAMVKGKKPFDKTAVVYRAENIAVLAKLPLEGFIDGTETGHTEARATLWKNKADFESKLSDMQQNTLKLLSAAKSGDESQVKQAFALTAKSCKACHDVYKKD